MVKSNTNPNSIPNANTNPTIQQFSIAKQPFA